MKGLPRRLKNAPGSAAPIQREFLPAAMELEATPPSPLGRGLLYLIMGLFTLALAWACIGRVDVIAVAEGTLTPSGKLRTLQAANLGTIRALHVGNGDQVRLGERLVTLDGTVTEADLQRLKDAISNRLRRLARHEALATTLHTALGGAEESAATLTRAALATADHHLAALLRALATADATLQQQADARRGELAVARADVERHRLALPLMEQRTQAVRVLMEDNLAPKNDWLELQQGLVGLQGDLNVSRHRITQLEAEIREIEQRRRQLLADSLRDTLDQTEQLQLELADLQQERIKAEDRHGQQLLRAPVSGVIHNTRHNTLGGVVQPAEPLLDIIPDDEALIVEAWVLNRDIGFVQEGQRVSLKIHTFEFTRYGTVPGVLTSVSHDAVIDEQAGPRYLARITPDRDWMQVGDKRIRFTPGMTVSAEIAIGERRLIEFFAAPIVSALNEAGRER